MEVEPLTDVDEVCNHAAVLNKGQLIFQGSLQDLKGRIRKNHYELDIEGDQKSIAKTVQQIKVMKEVGMATLRHRRLEMKLVDDVPNSGVLAMIFQTMSDNKVILVGMRSVGMQTEQAYLDMVEKEEQRGFTRLYQTAEAA